MIVFIIPVKHPENSKSYEKVWSLLNNSLSSFCNQRDTDFKIIVICNKKLPLKHNVEKISQYTEFIEVNFPPVNQYGIDGVRRDKGLKYTIYKQL